MVATHEDKKTRNQWFDELVAEIRADELQLETGTASVEKTEKYDMFMRGNMEEMFGHSKEAADKYFFSNVLLGFVRALFSNENKPFALNKLAFSYRDSQVLAWIEVPDGVDYDEAEKKIILADAKINATFYEKGYSLNTTIVEECDGLEVPSHYQSVLE